MAYKKYRFSLVSEELYGAARPNIVEAMLDDATNDADAFTFGSNLELCFNADVVTIDKELTTNYTLPYPAGTNTEWRMAMRDSAYILQTERIYDVKDVPTTPIGGLKAALATAGMKLYPSGAAVDSIQVAVFVPTASV